MGKLILINRITSSHLLIPSLSGSALRTHVESLGKFAMSTNVLKAFPGKLDIKRHSVFSINMPFILLIYMPTHLISLNIHTVVSRGTSGLHFVLSHLQFLYFCPCDKYQNLMCQVSQFFIKSSFFLVNPTP